MSRLQFSFDSYARAQSGRYEARLYRIAGTDLTPAATPAQKLSGTVPKILAGIAAAAALAVSLAIWRIYHYPH